jgi:hypothetical protein
MPVPGKVRGQAGEHENGSNSETVVPTVDLREESTKQRSRDCSEIDRHAEDCEATGAPSLVVARVKGTHLGGNIALEEA